MIKQVAVTIDPNGPTLTIEIVFGGDMGSRTVAHHLAGIPPPKKRIGQNSQFQTFIVK